MKRKYFSLLTIIMLTLALIFAFNCSKKSSATSNEKEESASLENTTQYIKGSCWAYTNEADIGKQPSDVQEKKLMKFGNTITVKGSKKIKGDTYIKISVPGDDKEYLVKKENVAKKFVIINQNDVKCYENPDESYITKFKLQPGDFGVVVQEGQDDWIKVEFNAYRPVKENGERVWVGTKWIKGGYTSDLTAAQQAYLLSLANFYYIQKKDPKQAIEYLKEAINVENGSGTEIFPIIQETLAEVEAQAK